MKNPGSKDAQYWIEKLQLEPHPEGGFFRQTYRSEVLIAQDALPAEFSGSRVVSTAIYFLLEGKNFSAFHRLRSDEVWHFYVGEPLVVHVIHPDGKYSRILLGRDPEAGQVLQSVVPGFDFEDFQMGKREELAARYPQHRELIERWTRD